MKNNIICFLSIIEYANKKHLSKETINYKSDTDLILTEKL